MLEYPSTTDYYDMDNVVSKYIYLEHKTKLLI